MSIEQDSYLARGVDAFIGIITIIVGAWILFDPALIEATLVFSVAIGLIFIGLARIFKSISVKTLTTQSRGMKAISGAAAILLAVIAIGFPTLTVTFLLTLLTFAIMLVGLSRMVVGYSEKGLPSWMRMLYIAGGGVAFLFGFFASIFSGLGLFTLRLMLSGTFFTLGIVRLVAAAKGEDA